MQAIIVSTEKGFCVQGPVSFANVVDLRFQGEKLLSTQQSITVDLSDMKDQDASALSLLLCWIRFSKKNKITLNLIHLPQSLQRMSKMFGLTEWTN